MKKLTQKKYWNKNYVGSFTTLQNKITSLTSKSVFFYEFNKIISPYLKPNHKILEIGCAPGSILISLAKKNKLIPYGVEYSKEGVEITKNNFEKNNFNKSNVICADFFSKKFITQNTNKYDVVCSFGFIEHFEDINKVIKLHTLLLKRKGVLIISVPNLSGKNKSLLEKEIIDKHNLKIMSPEMLQKAMPKNVVVKEKRYFGGPFNVGLLKYNNKLLEFIKNVAFIFQRLFIEPIIYLLSKLGLNFTNKWLSPGIIIIGIKK